MCGVYGYLESILLSFYDLWVIDSVFLSPSFYRWSEAIAARSRLVDRRSEFTSQGALARRSRS